MYSSISSSKCNPLSKHTLHEVFRHNNTTRGETNMQEPPEIIYTERKKEQSERQAIRTPGTFSVQIKMGAWILSGPAETKYSFNNTYHEKR